MAQFRRNLAVAALILAALAPPAAAQVDPPVTVPPPPGTSLGTPTGTQAATSAQTGNELVGLFRIDEGECGDEGVERGAWFRMIDPGGGYVENNDSPCDDKTWTPLSPGGDGGLLTGEYQPHPDPAFSDRGDGTNDRITEPQPFFGVRFSTATNQVDPQTETEVPPPSVTRDGAGNLEGDIRSFAAAWSNQHFNQGSPKPDGSRPDETAGPSGAIREDDGRYRLEWKSLIQGGPFNGFTGVWHFEGTFEASAATAGPSGGGEQQQPSPPPTTGGTAATPAADQPQAATGGDDRLARTGGPLGSAAAVVLGAAGLGGLVILRRMKRADG